MIVEGSDGAVSYVHSVTGKPVEGPKECAEGQFLSRTVWSALGREPRRGAKAHPPAQALSSTPSRARSTTTPASPTSPSGSARPGSTTSVRMREDLIPALPTSRALPTFLNTPPVFVAHEFGAVYYFNSLTGESSWEEPPGRWTWWLPSCSPAADPRLPGFRAEASASAEEANRDHFARTLRSMNLGVEESKEESKGGESKRADPPPRSRAPHQPPGSFPALLVTTAHLPPSQPRRLPRPRQRRSGRQCPPRSS